jgi:hypothetical protein
MARLGNIAILPEPETRLAQSTSHHRARRVEPEPVTMPAPDSRDVVAVNLVLAPGPLFASQPSTPEKTSREGHSADAAWQELDTELTALGLGDHRLERLQVDGLAHP